MRSIGFLVVLAASLAGCDSSPVGPRAERSAAPAASATADPLAAHDPAPGEQAQVAIPDAQARPVMRLQVVLDRLGFTPGVIDGKPGASTRNAIAGFQEANDLDPTGMLDDATRQALARWNNIPATRIVTIPGDFAAGPFHAIPDDPAQQAKMPALGYTSLDEKLAERFHTTAETLEALNPGGVPAGAPAGSAPSLPTPAPSATASGAGTNSGQAFTPQPGRPATFHAGQQIRVPNVGGDAIDPAQVSDAGWLQTLRTLGVGTAQPEADKIMVSKSQGTLKVFDASGKLVGMYTATMGSTHDPLPLGRWKVNGVAHNPPFHYNPDLFWDASASASRQILPPGPNGPVGVVWIDLNKPHYGIHGTSEPQTIGRAQSHGCVRLTNWDAARLAQMVSPGTQVLFRK